jgi:hypothetical protein
VDEQRRQIEAAVASGGLRLARIEAVEELQAFAEYAGQFGIRNPLSGTKTAEESWPAWPLL